MTELDPGLVDESAPAAPLEVEGQSPGAVFWTQMKKSPLAIAGGLLLVAFYVLALFAPFVAPYPQEAMDRQHYFQPPQYPHWVHADGHVSLRPFVRGTRVVDPAAFEYSEDATRELPLHFLVRGYEYKLFGLIPSVRHLYGVDGSERVALLGTDSFGRDEAVSYTHLTLPTICSV